MKRYLIAALTSVVLGVGVSYLVHLSPLSGTYSGGWIVGAVQQLIFWAVLYSFREPTV